jgi:hypothetical protein
MDIYTLEILDEARDMAEVPFIITSGYRTPEHNREIGGVENSAHTRGFAVDIAANNWGRETRNLVIMCLGLAGFNRIGEAHSFLHADVDESKPAPATWLYGQNENHKA